MSNINVANPDNLIAKQRFFQGIEYDQPQSIPA